MRHGIATSAVVAAAAVLAISATVFAKPKDRGMNQGEDQATYCQREHPGDELACCERGHARNLKRSCCRRGLEDEALACVGGAGNELWRRSGFRSLEECADTAGLHRDACLHSLDPDAEQQVDSTAAPPPLEHAGMKPGREQAVACRGAQGGDQACCGTGYDRNIQRACCRQGAKPHVQGPDLVCEGGAEEEIWEENGFASLQACEARATRVFNECIYFLDPGVE